MSRPRLSADRDTDIARREDGRELTHALVRRTREGDARSFVERNEVDLRAQASKQLDEPAGIGGRIVHTGEQHVFERDSTTAADRKSSTGVDQFLEPVFAVDRHERVPLLLGGRVQRHGQVGHEGLGRQPFEPREHADRRERHPARCDGEAMLVGEHAQGPHRLIVVVQGFAHAHEDDVERGLEQVQHPRQDADLSGNFSGGQIADDAHLPGEAEGAPHRAPDLRRDAERLLRRIGDVDRLDQPPIGEPEQELGGAVGRHVVPRHDRCGDGGALRERRPQRPREVGHGGEVRDAATMNPAVDLARMERCHALTGEGSFELRARQFSEVDAFGGHGAVARDDCSSGRAVGVSPDWSSTGVRRGLSRGRPGRTGVL